MVRDVKSQCRGFSHVTKSAGQISLSSVTVWPFDPCMLTLACEVDHSEKVLGLDPTLAGVSLCVEFGCSPCVCVGFLRVLPASSHSPNTCRLGGGGCRLIGDCNLMLWVWLVVCPCLSTLWFFAADPCTVSPASRPVSAGIGSSSPLQPSEDNWGS